jgi:hypothetical protein
MWSFSCWRSTLRRLVIGSIGLVLAFPPITLAEASTLNEVYVSVDGRCIASDGLNPISPIFGPACLRTTNTSATITGDGVRTSWLGVSSANTATSPGINKGSIDLYQAQTFAFDSTMSLAFSYSLDVLSPDEGTWRRLIDSSLNETGLAIRDPVHTILTAHLVLSWNVPYQIRSSLRVSGENAFTNAIAVSEWADVLAFTGGVGNTSMADLMVSINGALFSEEYFLPNGTSGNGCTPGFPCDSVFVAPTWVHHSYADFANSVVFGIAVPDNVRIQTESGTQYPSSVPEPAILITLGFGLACLAMARRKQFFTAVRKDSRLHEIVRWVTKQLNEIEP